jgi:hypothetical protein
VHAVTFAFILCPEKLYAKKGELTESVPPATNVFVVTG